MRDNRISERRREARSHSPDAKVVKIRTEGRGTGVIKTAAIGFLILLQLTVFLLLYLGFLGLFFWYQIVSFIASAICCLHVFSTKKTGQTKAVWVLFLTFFFTFGYLFYAMSNEEIFFGHAKRRFNKIFAGSQKFVTPQVDMDGVSRTVARDAEFLYNAGGFNAYKNSPLKYFPSGSQLFDDVLERLETAEKFIFIEYFIISDGVLLNRFFDILSRKSAEGVEVRIICDGFGSHGTLSGKMRKKMKLAGIKVFRFNRIIPWFTFALNLRDHRKIVVIDGKTAYTGGCNLADEYVNEKRMHGYWKDTGLRVEGEAVRGMALTFLRQWEFVTKISEDYAPYLKTQPKESAGVVIPYADGKDYEADIGKGVYSSIMAGAREKLYIMTPYFVPDEDTAALLAHKALSGVDVRLILPDVPDKAYVYRVSVDNAERLLPSGVKIYKMKRAFVHSKIVASENCAAVGSVNIDLRSYYNQFENGVYTDDKQALSQIMHDFDSTVSASLRVTQDNATRKKFIPRVLAGLLRVFSPLM